MGGPISEIAAPRHARATQYEMASMEGSIEAKEMLACFGVHARLRAYNLKQLQVQDPGKHGGEC